MKKLPSFRDLPDADQKVLVEHMRFEFNMSFAAAEETCKKMDKRELQTHLDAAKEGYI